MRKASLESDTGAGSSFLIADAQAGLRLLVEASACAQHYQEDAWQFAVEIQVLWQAGFTNSALRSLLREGYVEHAEELSAAGRARRAFRDLAPLALTERTCFVLTARGARLAQSPAAAR